MKALVYTGTQQMEFREEPEPTLSIGEVLLKVEAAGICGSDMHAFHGHDERRIPPLILGHEVSGIATGGKFEGKRMAINPLITCGHCLDCLGGRTNLCATREIIGLRLQGAFADYVKIPEANLIPMDNTVSAVTSSLMEPAAVSLHSVVLAEKILHRSLSECRVLVIGGGAIGLLAALVLAQKGAATIMLGETNAGRRATVSAANCCIVFDPLSNDTPEHNSFDLVIDAVGSGATRASSSLYTKPGGVISHIGLQDNEAGLDTRKLTLQEITFIGNYTYTPVDLIAALSALSSGALGTLEWVETRPLSKGAGAFQDIHEGKSHSPKIVLLP